MTREANRSDGGYFDGAAAARMTLLWSTATRRQLDRWERLVAQILQTKMRKQEPAGHLVWEAETERHLALVAAGNLGMGLGLAECTIEPQDADLVGTLVALRNVIEHWDQHMPYFNVRPHPREPEQSGKTLVRQDPARSPFSHVDWASREGPILWSDVASERVRALLDDVDQQVVAQYPVLGRFLPDPSPSPWLGPDARADGWWPSPAPNPGGRRSGNRGWPVGRTLR